MIKKIGVIGAGTMGHGIAQSFAMFGYNVNLYDTNAVQLEKALNEIRAEQQLLVEEAFITAAAACATLQNITVHTDLQTAVQDRDYVIEAAPENMELKQNLFKQLDGYCPAHTILASNTSSLSLEPMMALVSEARKQRMMVCHWYNPGHLMPLAELSFFGNMPAAIYADVETLYQAIGKQTVKVLKDVPGEEIAAGIRAVYGGDSLISPSMASKLLAEFALMRRRTPPAVTPTLPKLTDREVEVLGLVARGMGNREIGAVLFISENTVKNHVRNILEKLQMHTRMEAAMYAVSQRLITPPTGG